MRFISDTHIGLNRMSNTTPESRRKWKRKVFETVMGAAKTALTPVTHCGDLFDSCSNSEEDILAGYDLAKNCWAVLSGNHDLTNRDSRKSSLDLLRELDLGEIVVVDPYYGTDISMVPHCRTQQEFVDILGKIEGNEILCLHCNYDLGHDPSDSTLNLSSDVADILLERFDYIVLGHEHNARVLKNGRLIILGSTFPTSFSDMTDKFCWDYRDGKFTPTLTWSKDRFLSVSWQDLLEGKTEDADFIEITGTAPAKHMPEIAKKAFGLWRQQSDLLAVRNNVKAESLQIELKDTKEVFKDIPTRISRELDGTELGGIWNKYLDAA